MRQNWRRLLFLHWALDPSVVQATLPEDLSVETWGGRAWVAVVPFAMERVGLRGNPRIPGLPDFLELNVRTYVRDVAGRSAVWFYSLDCSNPLAVWGAQTFFGLPYRWAKMTEHVGLGGIHYTCRRWNAEGVGSFRYRGRGALERARPGTLEEFLIERYRLFSRRRGRLIDACVEHEPYQVQSAELSEWSTLPLCQAGFDIGSRRPDHAVFAPGVDVLVGGPSRPQAERRCAAAISPAGLPMSSR